MNNSSIIRLTAERLAAQKDKIAVWADKYDISHEIQLLAVSKTISVEAIRAAHQAGQEQFGENYLQEAQAKMELLKDLPLVWHFIGRVQSNKTRPLAEAFDWVQTVSSVKIARRLNEQRPPNKVPLNICVQVNISYEEGKAGCPPAELLSLCEAIKDFPCLRLRGLMAIPAYSQAKEQQRKPLAELAKLFHQVKQRLNLTHWDTLSMGMSGDLEAAIQEGTTMVRLGTNIFGPREN